MKYNENKISGHDTFTNLNDKGNENANNSINMKVYRVPLKHKRFIDDQFEEDLAGGDVIIYLF